ATPEIISTCRAMRAGGAVVLGITNEPRSPLAGAVDLLLGTDAGPERAVPATQTVTTQFAVLVTVTSALRTAARGTRDIAAGGARGPRGGRPPGPPGGWTPGRCRRRHVGRRHPGGAARRGGRRARRSRPGPAAGGPLAWAGPAGGGRARAGLRGGAGDRAQGE